MRIDIRWKNKSREVEQSVYPENYGSPTHKVTEIYKVLEFRHIFHERPATGWTEVPHVGLDD